MAGYRNFLLGVVLGAALVAPTAAHIAAPAQGDNALAVFAAVRAEAETRVSASAASIGSGVLRWLQARF